MNMNESMRVNGYFFFTIKAKQVSYTPGSIIRKFLTQRKGGHFFPTFYALTIFSYPTTFLLSHAGATH